MAWLPQPRSDVLSAIVTRGDTAQADGHFAEAIHQYQAGLEIHPTDSLLLDKLVTSSLAANRTDLALIYLERLTAVTGWSPSLYRRAAAIYSQQRRTDIALAYWYASLQDRPDDRNAFRQLVTAALAQREWDEALTYLQRWLQIDPHDEWALYQAGLLLAPKELATTQRYLSQALADPQYRAGAQRVLKVFSDHPADLPPTLALRVGLALLDSGEWSLAEHAFTVALIGDPNNPNALAFLGLSRDQQGLDGAAQVERALALAPDDPQVRYVAAVHWRIRGDTAQALAILDQLGTQNPVNAAVAAEIGTVYRVLGDQVKTLEWYKLAVGLAPENEQFAALLAAFYVDEDIRIQDEGLLVISNLAQKFSNNATIITCYGWALYRVGRPNEARINLERALSLNSTDDRARYLYALFMDSIGERNTAISSLLYVYQNATEQRFRDLAIRALTQMGYQPNAQDLIGKLSTSP
ncbi:MAG: tetratricopeptide repeat protein [Anaerolineae bacterium]|nr:tetratricopeptide repeat protein [Anaerolineae bacterium]